MRGIPLGESFPIVNASFKNLFYAIEKRKTVSIYIYIYKIEVSEYEKRKFVLPRECLRIQLKTRTP